TSSGSAVFTAAFKVGQYASLVEAIWPLYLEPTFEPERTMPPGNGVITSGTSSMARTARSQAASTAACDLPSTSRLPPPTAFLVRPVVASHTNSPSITGMRQKRRPPTLFDICQPSPKNLSEAPSLSFFSPCSPAKQAEPGLVSTHWP